MLRNEVLTVGMLEYWNIGFWENGNVGYGKIPLYGN